MISRLVRFPIALSAIGPVINSQDALFDRPRGKNYSFPKTDDETGWERVKRMFRTDDFGAMSGELNSIYQASFLGMFTGAVYGGFLGSRKSYFDFMDRNQATAFNSHLDAKRKLQDQVTMGFAKNAFRFGWRLGLFSTSYTGITTVIAVYRGKSSLYEYIIGGAATGAMYKFNMGLRGMAAGALIGGGLGTVAGGVSLLILKSTGMTMEEVRYWQYKWRANRDETISQGYKTQMRGTEHHDELIIHHDSKPEVGERNLDIKILELQENKAAAIVEAPAIVTSDKK